MSEPIYLNGWRGGINQALAAKDIADHELADAVNIELSLQSSLRRRPGVSKVIAAGGPFTSRITSIYPFAASDGSETVLYTDKTGAWRHTPGEPNSPNAMTDIASGVTLGTTARFEWVTMDDVAIGVNGTSAAGGTYTNPVVLSATSGVLDDVASDGWTGSYPTAPEHIAVWNRRVWMSEGNQLYGSALGDRTDHTSTGGSGRFQDTVGEDEGSDITGIVPFYDRLIIFKGARIYQLIAGSPNVDANQYEIRNLTRKVGCLDVGSVQEVMNDLYFLSEYGVMSLQAVAQFGDFMQARLSQAIPSLSALNTSAAHVGSVVRPDKDQYWLAVPSTEGSTDNTVVWVLDFKNKGQGLLPWMKFDGGVCGSEYNIVSVRGEQKIYIGGYDDAYMLDLNRWDDDVGASYAPSGCYFDTKSYDLGDPLRRKEYKKVGLQLQALSDPVEFTLRWTLDDNPNRRKTISSSFSALSTGSELDDAAEAFLWTDALDSGSFLLATDSADDADLIWSLRGVPGRRAQTCGFRYSVASFTQGFVIRRMMLIASLLRTLYGVSDNAELS